MKFHRLALALLVLLVGAAWLDAQPKPPADRKPTLAEARRGFKTKLLKQKAEREALDKPPADLFRTALAQIGIGTTQLTEAGLTPQGEVIEELA